MSEDKADANDQPEAIETQASAEDSAEGIDAALEDTVDAVEAPTIEALQEALNEAQEQILRAQAETENVRKRAERDVANAHKFALDRFTAELLPVIDSFEAAVQTAREHGGEQGDVPEASVVAIAQGMELALKLLFDVMERAGVKIVDPVGEPFDPTLHEAMGMVDSPDAEPGSVIHVVQKGYTLNDRLVRAAMVMVAKAAADQPSEKS